MFMHIIWKLHVFSEHKLVILSSSVKYFAKSCRSIFYLNVKSLCWCGMSNFIEILKIPH